MPKKSKVFTWILQWFYLDFARVSLGVLQAVWILQWLYLNCARISLGVLHGFCNEFTWILQWFYLDFAGDSIGVLQGLSRSLLVVIAHRLLMLAHRMAG